MADIQTIQENFLTKNKSVDSLRQYSHQEMGNCFQGGGGGHGEKLDMGVFFVGGGGVTHKIDIEFTATARSLQYVQEV